jgi:N6-adenosine-specific RNA methylase IME4
MKLSDIAKTIMRANWLDGAPVLDLAHDAHAYCWVTDNFLLDGLSLLEQLGFHYKRTFVWVKVKNKLLAGLVCRLLDILGPLCLQIGLGQYARGAHEILLFGTRGRAMVPPPERRPPSVIFAPRTEHSRKPDESYELVEKVSPGPYLELFARRLRPGWQSWGNEIPEAMPTEEQKAIFERVVENPNLIFTDEGRELFGTPDEGESDESN